MFAERGIQVIEMATIKVKKPHYARHILSALGIDSIEGEYHFDGENLTVEGVTDTQISAAEAGLDIPLLDKAERNAIVNIERREAYPPIGDQLDAIWKQIAKLKADGIALDADADKSLKKILDIKKAHKKEK